MRSTIRVGVVSYWPHIVAVIAIVLLALVSTLLWLEMSKKFPAIEPGSYLGRIDGIFKGEEGSELIYVERAEGDSTIFIAVLKDGWDPQIITLWQSTGLYSNSDTLPVMLTGPNTTLRFVGTKIGPHEYRGTVQDLESTQYGRWSLSAITRGESGDDGQDKADITLALLLNWELYDLQNNAKKLEEQAATQKEEIARLTEFLSNKELVREESGKKLRVVQEELRQLKNEYQVRKSEIDKVRDQFLVAEKVTQMGKLAALSRESMEREWRWMDSMLKFDSSDENIEFEAALKKAEEIAQVKAEIAVEKARLSQLQSVEGRPFDAIWEGKR